MRVHIFGNTSSPSAIATQFATHGLRKTAIAGELEYGRDARGFVEKDFCVDDGLKSVPTMDQNHAVRSQPASSQDRFQQSYVTQAFAAEDQASDLRNLDFHRDTIPIQRSLGVSQDLRTDTFTLTKLNYSRDVGSCPQPIASRDRCSRSHQS